MDCGICLQPMMAYVGPCGGGLMGRRAGLENCTHIFCYGCIAKWAAINQTCPSCRSEFLCMYVLDNEDEKLQTIIFETKQPKGEEDQEAEEEDMISGSGGEDELTSSSSDASADADEFVEFLDDFVVPDGTIEFEDNAASLPSPSRLGMRRRRTLSQVQVIEEDEERQVHVEQASSSRREMMNRLVEQRRQRQEHQRNRPWFRDALPSDEEVLASDEANAQGARRRRRSNDQDQMEVPRLIQRRRYEQHEQSRQASSSSRLQGNGLGGTASEDEVPVFVSRISFIDMYGDEWSRRPSLYADATLNFNIEMSAYLTSENPRAEHRHLDRPG